MSIEWFDLQPQTKSLFITITPDYNSFYLSSKVIEKLGDPDYVAIGLERGKNNLIISVPSKIKPWHQQLRENNGKSKRFVSKELCEKLKGLILNKKHRYPAKIINDKKIKVFLK